MKKDEEQIRELVRTWLAASESGDHDTVLSLMAEEVMFLVPGKAPFGKKEFAAMSKQMGNVKMQGTSEIEELRIVDNWAWMRSSLRVRAMMPDGKTVVRSGSTLSILRKNEVGRWVILRDANLLAPEG
jgi:uncharacterized protein (TIGR02246 family)